MKRLISLLIIFLLLFSFAYAENVSCMEYSLTIHGFTLSGYYTGETNNGIPNGYGVYETQTPNGTPCHYIGNWRNGIMHGSGATYWNDGSLEIGEYAEGDFVSGRYNYNGLKLLIARAEGDETLNPYWLNSNSHVSYQQEDDEQEVMYIGNRNSHVFHRLDCDSVRTMKEKNKVEFYTREEAIDSHYTPCNRCQP